jgi:RIO-like serine/threonine protein kinase
MLTLSNSDLMEQNEELQKKVATMAASTESKDIGVDDSSLAVLNAIATLTERDIRVELDNIESLVRLGKIKTHAALDVLKESGLVSATGNVRGIRYRLTAQGRVYYLEHKD